MIRKTIRVDIAIRALSPAINDPTTAVQAIDQIEDLLRRLGRAFAVLRLTTNSHFVTGGPCTITAVYELGEPFIQRVFDLVTFIDIIGGSTERGLWWNNPTDIWHL